MIVAILNGGLGNQLFQLSAALRASGGAVDNVRISLQFMSGGQNTYRLSEIFDTGTLPKVFSDADHATLAERVSSYKVLKDCANPFIDNPLLDLCSDNVVLDGYFQSERTASFLLDAISEGKLKFSNSFREKLTVPSSKVGIVHFRGGDYRLKSVQENLGLLALSYVDAVLEKFRILGFESIRVITNDKQVREIYQRAGISTNDASISDIEDFAEMINADGLGISNSTFALWALYLGQASVRVRPAHWSRKFLEDDLTPDPSVYRVWNSFYVSAPELNN